MGRAALFFLFFIHFQWVTAQSSDVQEYIDRYKDLAMEEMRRTGMPASIKLAQGILESEAGRSDLTIRSNNHFGIKCKSYWTGESVKHHDDARNECFRKYPSAEDSYKDHSDYLRATPRYTHLFELDPLDYRAWSYGLKKAGYATNPRYPEILIRNIEKYDLQQYSLEVLNGRAFSSDDKEETGVAFGDVSPDLPEPEMQESNRKKITATPGVKVIHNGLKAVYTEKGTSLLAMASRLKISLSRLLDYNDLTSDGLLDADQWIYLERKLKEGKTDYHIMGEGESMYRISQEQGVQLSQLLHYNRHLNLQELRAGSRVYLREVAFDNKSLTRAGGSAYIVHEVQPGEGLYNISRKYSVTVEDIRELNNIKGDSIRVGQQLIISK